MADHETASRDTAGGYERSDVAIWVIGLIALVSIVWLAAVPLILAWGYPRALSDAGKKPQVTAPPPRLQTDPNQDLVAFRARVHDRLTSYGWVDREKGIVHIPIDKAMEKVAHDGIPGWPTTGKAQ